ncbi:hypothetical protein SAMN04487859_103102 [Roseovarius lutimaris]|uniref:Sulfotransferase family protein n=1 Tax=Roseovarius lutimaris TaxID=1005928 RepID=A0A1I4ZBT3_9RHOB|nr:hypothetical protein [Roseovarius lutimaris]SFN47752.1 hypothetical protein SAMN04487859_103102 [Roseovarius lutimaris]
MSVVTIHVGMPKCATTTIQKFLGDRDDWLAQHGYVYEKHPDDHTEGQGNAAFLAELSLSSTPDKAVDHLRYFLRSNSNVLLSSEMLFGLGRGKGFAPILEEIEHQGYDVHVIAYLKRQDLWIESDYKQHVKDGNLWVSDFRQLLGKRESKKTLDYHWTLSNWANQVGSENLSVVPLNPSQPGKYAVERFLELMGVPMPESSLDVERQNVSPSAGMIEAARHLKKHLIREGEGPDDIVRMLRHFFSSEIGATPTDHDREILSPQDRRRLVERYSESNSRLAQTFLRGVDPFDDLDLESHNQSWVEPSQKALEILSAMAAGPLKQQSAQRASEVARQSPSMLGKIGAMLRR